MFVLHVAMFTCLAGVAAAEAPRPFAIVVIDEQTGRGVPLVELRTTSNLRFYTDSAGVAAIDEPDLVGRKVYFHVASHGYEFPADGFGIRGQALDVASGRTVELKVKRLNIAERLYRITGAGIYRDSVLAGRPVPLREPLLNARVTGSDSVLMAAFGGRLHWFWGDTNRPEYPLGNFHTTGATSELPSRGGLDPASGIDFTYFVGDDGFAAPLAHMPGEGPTWLTGLTVLRDTDDRERMLAGYMKIKPPLEVYERGLVEFDTASERFQHVATFPLDAPLYPHGHPYLHIEEGTEYAYFADPYPLVRVRATVDDLADPARYEAYTCLPPGARLAESTSPPIDRDEAGQARYAWRADTAPIRAQDQARLVQQGVLSPDEAWLQLRVRDKGKPIVAHAGSVAWNQYRQRWVMIAVELFGTSALGEVWYAEADDPVGPWRDAVKIVTHERYSFYNPKHHPAFDQDGGRIIYFEGTYSTFISGNESPTPRYDYNQMMYRLDLADERLRLPRADQPAAP
jgi:hypothetical protein